MAGPLPPAHQPLGTTRRPPRRLRHGHHRQRLRARRDAPSVRSACRRSATRHGAGPSTHWHGTRRQRPDGARPCSTPRRARPPLPLARRASCAACCPGKADLHAPRPCRETPHRPDRLAPRRRARRERRPRLHREPDRGRRGLRRRHRRDPDRRQRRPRGGRDVDGGRRVRVGEFPGRHRARPTSPASGANSPTTPRQRRRSWRGSTSTAASTTLSPSRSPSDSCPRTRSPPMPGTSSASRRSRRRARSRRR